MNLKPMCFGIVGFIFAVILFFAMIGSLIFGIFNFEKVYKTKSKSPFYSFLFLWIVLCFFALVIYLVKSF